MTDGPHSHAAVFDRAAATYDRVGVDFFSVFGRQLVADAAIAAGESVLDIGTGRGAVLFPASEAVGDQGQVVGLDLAPGMVERTSRACRERGLSQCRVVIGDAADPPISDQRFDAVLSSLVLFFLADPAAALVRWAALVALGGRLGLVTFADDPDDDRFADVVKRHLPASTMAAAATVDDAQIDIFTLVRDPEWLKQALTQAGMTRIQTRELRHQTVFRDADHMVEWGWSQGMRAVLEQIPAEGMPDFVDDIGQDLDRHRLTDGRLGMHVTVRLTVARRSEE